MYNKRHEHQEEFEDTKEVIIIRKSKKNRQNNDQENKYKIPNNDLQNINNLYSLFLTN
jgi:hypothetical protein